MGFILTIAIWSFTGYRFARHVADVRREAAELDQRYVRAQELLSNVRTQVLLGSVYVRDALIDQDQTKGDDYRHRIEATFQAVDSALQEYEPVLDSPAELKRIERLRQEINSFRHAMLDIVAAEKRDRPSNPLPLLQGRVVPGRDVVLDVSDEVQRLNRSAYVRQQATVADVFATDEDTPLVVQASDFLGNDTDVDRSDVLTLLTADALSHDGASITLGGGGATDGRSDSARFGSGVTRGAGSTRDGRSATT